MELKQLIELAEKEVGGTRPLARELGCAAPVLTRFKTRNAGPAWIAVACAELVGADQIEAERKALASTASTEKERAFWMGKLKRSTAAACVMFVLAACLGLGVSSKSYAATAISAENQPGIYIIDTYDT